MLARLSRPSERDDSKLVSWSQVELVGALRLEATSTFQPPLNTKTKTVRIVLQRVSRASIRVEGSLVSEIGHGLLLLVGIEVGDSRDQGVAAAEKILGLRVFSDVAGKMNLDIRAVEGELLVVSQFTLASSTRRGRRPSFSSAARPEEAVPLLRSLVEALSASGLAVAEGQFGAAMEVRLVNDGPVTFFLEFPPPGAGT